MRHLLLLALTFPFVCGSALRGQDGANEKADREATRKVNAFFTEMDKNRDGKVPIDELKERARKRQEQDKKGTTSYLGELGRHLPDFLSADADDNLELTKAELLTFTKEKAASDPWRPALSVKDVQTFEKEFCGPYADGVMERADSNKDGEITREEAKAASDKSPTDKGWDKLDTNGDGKATRTEIIEWVKNELADSYELPKNQDDNADKPDEADPWALYRKKGRLWVHKTQVEFPDMTITTYAKEEVIEVMDTHAKIRRSSWGEGKEDTPKTMERTVEFKNPERLPKNKYKTEETITVKAGEFDCYKHSVENAKRSRAEWWHKNYPLLEVKIVATEKDGTTTTELIEFKE